MRGFFHWVVRARKVLLAVFLAAAFVWAWLSCLMFLALGVA